MFVLSVFDAAKALLILPMIIVWLPQDVAADAVLANCTTIGISLPTANASVNVSCPNLILSDVVLQGNMMLNISIAGIAMANPAAQAIGVSLLGVTVQSGATLAIDSSGYIASSSAAGRGPTLSILIESLIGNDGCLVLIGAFPPGTTIVVSRAQMKSSSAAAPRLAMLDPFLLTFSKIVMLVNVSIAENSSLSFVNTIVAATSTTELICPFLITGVAPHLVANGSTVTYKNITVSAANGDAFRAKSPVTFFNKSTMTVSLCMISTSASSGGKAFFLELPVTFSHNSTFSISLCTVTSSAASAFVMNSAVGFFDNSVMAVSSCTMTSQGGMYAFLMLTSVVLSSFSTVSISLSNFSTTSSLYGDAFAMKSLVTLSSNCTILMTSCMITSGSGRAFYLDTPAFSAFSTMVVASCTMQTLGGGTVISVFSDVAFSNYSSLVVVSCTLTSSGSAGGGDAFTIFSSAALTNHSFILITACTLTSAQGNAIALRSPSTFESSALTVAFCNLTSGGGSACSAFALYSTAIFSALGSLTLRSCTISTTAAGGYALYLSSLDFKHFSSMTVASCTVASTASGYSAFLMSSPATFSNYSFIVLASSTLKGYDLAFDVDSIAVNDWSYMLVTNNTFASFSSSFPPVALDDGAPLVVGSSSWVLWKGNFMMSQGGFGACIVCAINFSTNAAAGAVSIVDNNCTCSPNGAIWNASTVEGVSRKVFQRCNRINGVLVSGADSGQLPAGTISRGTCGSCDASVDCFGPLTADSSTCNISSSTSPAVCRCLPMGVAANMCLMPSAPAGPAGAAERTSSPTSSIEIASSSLSVTEGSTTVTVSTTRGGSTTGTASATFAQTPSVALFSAELTGTFSRSVSARFTFSNSATEEPPQVAERAAFRPTATYASAVAFSTAAVLPATAFAVQRSLLLGSLVQCSSFTLNATLDLATSPTTLVVGTGNAAFVRGALIGNWLFWSGCVGVAFLVAKGISLTSGKSLGSSWMGLSMPGNLIAPFSFLVQPTVMCSVAAILNADGAGDILFGLASLGGIALIAVAVAIHLTIRFGATSVRTRASSVGRRRLLRAISFFFGADEEWVDKVPNHGPFWKDL